MENEIKKETKKSTPKKETKPKAPVKTKIDPKTGTLKVVAPKAPKKDATKSKTTKKATTKSTTSKSSTKTTSKEKKVAKPKATPKKKEVKVEEQIIAPVVEAPTSTTTDIVDEAIKVLDDVTLNPQPSIPNVPVVEPIDIANIPNETEEVTTSPSEKPEPAAKKRGRKPSENPLPKKSSRELTIEPPKREPKVEPKKEEKKPAEPVVIVRPTPKKTHTFTKEEKVLYKKLQEAFNYVANLTNVIEERTMDTKLIPDLTVGELHVIEAVDKNNNKPMTLIAKELKVTVGSLTISLNRLVQKGYLLRTRHEMDHRIILVSITPKGKKALKTHDAFHDTIIGLVLDSLTLKQTYTVMNQFAMVLENYFDPKTIGTQTQKKGSKK